MRVVLGPGCDNEWVSGLSPWQREDLAAIFRQGRGLRDGTNHGSDMRWCQSGVKTRDGFGTHRTPRREGHERIFILRRDYGYEIVGARRLRTVALDGDTGAEVVLPAVWVPTERWYVTKLYTANYPPSPNAPTA